MILGCFYIGESYKFDPLFVAVIFRVMKFIYPQKKALTTAWA
jgi:hypothetical protein